MLTSWADELVRALPYPAYQLCTDDFTGRLANNTNLGAKGIIALEAFAQLCRLTGAATTDCDRYSKTANDYAQVWMHEARAGTAAPHYKMSYNPVADVNDSWSIKYNLLWQKLLKLDGPFPWSKVVPDEVRALASRRAGCTRGDYWRVGERGATRGDYWRVGGRGAREVITGE